MSRSNFFCVLFGGTWLVLLVTISPTFCQDDEDDGIARPGEVVRPGRNQFGAGDGQFPPSRSPPIVQVAQMTYRTRVALPGAKVIVTTTPYLAPVPVEEDVTEPASISDAGSNTNTDALAYVTCDFDTNFCDFTNDPNAQIQWTRRNLKQTTLKTGPDRDHSVNGTGYFALFEVGSKPAGSQGRLISPELYAPFQCASVSFWYFAYGTQLNRLTVKAVSSPGTRDEIEDVIFETLQPNEVVKKWQLFEKTFTLFNVHYKVAFEAEAGNGPEGNFAIDEVVIRADACSKSLTLKPGQKVSKAIKGGTTAASQANSGPAPLSGTAIAAIVIVVVIVVVALIPVAVWQVRKRCPRKGGLSPLNMRPVPGDGSTPLDEEPSTARREDETTMTSSAVQSRSNNYSQISAGSSVVSTPANNRPVLKQQVAVPPLRTGYDQNDNLGYLRRDDDNEEAVSGVRTLNEVAINIINEHPPLPAPASTTIGTQPLSPPPAIHETSSSLVPIPSPPVLHEAASSTLVPILPPNPPVQTEAQLVPISSVPEQETRPENQLEEDSSNSSDDSSSWSNRALGNESPQPAPVQAKPTRSAIADSWVSSTFSAMTPPSASARAGEDEWSSGEEAEAQIQEHYRNSRNPFDFNRSQTEPWFAASNNSTTMYEYPNAANWRMNNANNGINRSIDEELASPRATGGTYEDQEQASEPPEPVKTGETPAKIASIEQLAPVSSLERGKIDEGKHHVEPPEPPPKDDQGLV